MFIWDSPLCFFAGRCSNDPTLPNVCGNTEKGERLSLLRRKRCTFHPASGIIEIEPEIDFLLDFFQETAMQIQKGQENYGHSYYPADQFFRRAGRK